ncbi:MAG: hypothetical protein PUA74_00820, partial [Clostridiales bacterium]|nr:hypothetical protein [Clostridiales bacterium]
SDSANNLAKIKDISTKELSRQAIDGVRVCDKVRFDFKMSPTPSVTLRVTPPSRGRLFDSFIVNEKSMSNRCF